MNEEGALAERLKETLLGDGSIVFRNFVEGFIAARKKWGRTEDLEGWQLAEMARIKDAVIAKTAETLAQGGVTLQSLAGDPNPMADVTWTRAYDAFRENLRVALDSEQTKAQGIS